MDTLFDFPTQKQELFQKSTTQIPNRMGIVRTDTDQLISIVSPTYNLIPHKSVIDLFDNIQTIKRENVEVYKNGAVMFANYEILNHGIEEKIAVGDVAKFKMRVFNSYNRTMPVGLEIYAVILKCLNGMKIPQQISRISYPHINNVTIERIESQINEIYSSAHSITDTWRKWAKTKPSIITTNAYFQAIEPYTTLEDIKVLRERATRKNCTVWNIFDDVTERITHHTKSTKDAGFKKYKRENEALGIFYNHEWN